MMNRISLSIELIKEHYDVVVIGSGYGGGISASRLARAGKNVCLLERGREILPGEYPNTEEEALKDLQFHTPDGHIGSKTGLYDIYVNKEQNVVIGCGLGGTSLINANVSLEPEPKVFEDKRWPQKIREHQDTLLKEGFQRARDMLKPTPYPETSPTLPKLEANQKSAAAMGQNFYRPPINVTFEDPENGINHVGVPQSACTNCGDCVSGCNYGAKNTTLMNYLPDAWNHGAEIFCNVLVKYIEKHNDGWLIHYEPIDEGREKFDAPTLFIKASLVVISAGTLGSTEILLRSKEKGLSLSNQLGQNFSGNGDILGFCYNCDQTINGIGFGHLPVGEINPVGPCITSIIDMRNEDSWRSRMVIEEGSIPGAMGKLMPISLSAAAEEIGQDTDTGFIDKIKEKTRAADSLIRGPYHGAINNTQTYLIMSHDNGEGVMKLENDQLRVNWPEVGEQVNFKVGNKRLKQATAALGGDYVENPIWTKLFNHSLITVHPLGGAVMGENAEQGVVNHKGQVFSGNSGTAVYSDLYVTDGSVIPTSLAVNPLLTISAISERCCALIAQDRGWSIHYDLPSKPSKERLADINKSKKIGITFTETMKGYFSTQFEAGESLNTYHDAEKIAKSANSTMEFTLTISSDNLDEMLKTPEHAAQIIGTLNAPTLSDQPLLVNNGVFNLFELYPETPDTRHMNYKMHLTAENNKQFYFSGYKVINDDPDVFDIWPDTSTLYVTVYHGNNDQGSIVGKGILHIEPEDFLKQMTTMKATNTTSAVEKLSAEARFGKYFAGVLWETYGGIFYSESRFNPDAPPRKKRPLRVRAPVIHPFKTEDDVNLRLTRYHGGDKGPVMLVHGLGVSSTIFSTDTIQTNLLEYLYAHCYDVWLLDFRVSIALPAAKQQSTGDQVAKYDFPAAVDVIRSKTGCDTIQAVVHCYGATTFFMSMLAGLQHVRSIVCSQIATNIVVPTATKIKTGIHLPSFLDMLGVESLTAYVDNHESLVGRLYDKALDIYAMKEAQGQCNNPVCHRITFLYASLYRHTQLNNLLHSNLHELFAEANITTFEHLAEICRKGIVVNFEGQDIYMSNIDSLNLPICFIYGAENQCYLPESTEITYNILREKFPSQQYSRKVIPEYGHIDCIFGAHAVEDVYPEILAHLEQTAEAKKIKYIPQGKGIKQPVE
ncbi:GMC family oxidoreductase N-terminal domain-containing protein [Zooshikella harenae]|uniref:Cholesterol oxidase n=1 Tax=Zooshikella harenae TaxID=2827238 RepID=A0ABS5ZFK5_9GAMM|nr:GMC family oxidoreductase N-terminal domain-containing protein [Zooshikella harenae]MBU2712020.1 GMC family oxidoreductase N-terminal domain-containing protein [Zooshikella harenae]